jgi:hypothetical protein
MKKPPLNDYAAANVRRPCRLSGCSLGRVAFSPFCRSHAARVERYGHPEGRPIDPKEYAFERQSVEKLLATHSEHEGVKSAVQWFQRWLDAAQRGEDVPGGRDFARLGAHGVSPLSILVEASALFLYSRWNPRKLPDDTRLDFAAGLRVLSLVPREKRFGFLNGKPRHYCRSIGKVARREVGRRIRLNLAPLLVNIAEAVTAEQEQAKQFALSLRTPFQQPKEE